MERNAGNIAYEVNLENRKILVERLCMRCGQTEESVHHELRQCPAAMEVWHQLQFTWDSGSKENGESVEQLSQRVERLN